MSLSPDQRSSGPRITCKPVNTEPNEYSPEERKLLLKLAHEAILTSLEHRELSLNPVPPHLAEPRGAFTTLYLRGDLRGCVGHVYPLDSLYHTVAETARAAAFEDTRFWPITGLLLPQVPIEHGWDRITFLEQTCRKAGLPADAWRAGAQIEVFTAEVFGDRDRD